MNARLVLFFRVLYGLVANLLIFGGLLFIPAGVWDWPRAWVFLGVVTVAGTLTMVCLDRYNNGLMEERLKPLIQKGQPLADKIILMAFIASYFACIVLIPLDVFHWRLMPRVGFAISLLGLPVFLAGWRIMCLALRENAFAAPVVKLQSERKQVVVDTGLYGLVRHPMYMGAVLVFLGMPLWLRSYAALLAMGIPVGLLLVRIRFEEDFLRKKLPGYAEYMQKVRWRLIPGVW